ncbi:MAG: hypothetical protein SangKO_036040 [Sandaracinaceae bacterium]
MTRARPRRKPPRVNDRASLTAARDPLASEARDHLRSLKVSEAEQRRLLSAHYPASVVDLVLR